MNGGTSWADRLTRHPLIAVLTVAATLATIGGFFLQLRDTGSGEVVVAGPTPGPAGATPQPSPTSPPGTEPLDDQAIANLVVLQSQDLSQGWTSFSSRSRAESVASFESVPECTGFVPIIRGDGETAIAGRDVFFVDGNTSVSVIVTFYETEALAQANGPALLLDLDYQRCVRAKVQNSIIETNGPVENLDVASQRLVAPAYGQRSEAVQFVADFTLPQLGDQAVFTDEWSVQIGRAVLLMQWSSDVEFDPVELELFQTVGQRFERTMALYGG